MRIKLITSVGSAALILSGSVFAASPVNFGLTTTDSTGTISAGTSCTSTGATCSAPVSDVGFFQQELTDSAGNRYFHTRVEDAGFTDENWVKAGATGIRGQQNISETADSALTPTAGTVADTRDVFSSNTTLNMGWGSTDATGLNQVSITQGISQEVGTLNTAGTFTVAAIDGVQLNESFSLKDGLSAFVGTTTTIAMNAGRQLDIGQITSTGLDTAGNATHQAFAQKERSGVFNGGGAFTMPAGTTVDNFTGVTSNTDGTYTMSNTAGDTLALTYIGQTVGTDVALGDVQKFGWGFLANETTGGAAELGLSFTNTNNPATGTTGLTAVFGALPTFTAP